MNIKKKFPSSLFRTKTAHFLPLYIPEKLHVYQLNNMVDAQKNPIPDFSLQESYYHLFQRLGERNSGLTTYASKIFKSCCFEPEIIETK
jgi:hypothetical protein